AAARYVQTWTRRTLYEKESSPGYADDPDPILLNDDVKAAMLLLIGHCYANTEALNIGNLTSSVPLTLIQISEPKTH
ncbi:head-tail connector protein, partial [Enterobacter hormaechei]